MSCATVADPSKVEFWKTFTLFCCHCNHFSINEVQVYVAQCCDRWSEKIIWMLYTMWCTQGSYNNYGKLVCSANFCFTSKGCDSFPTSQLLGSLALVGCRLICARWQNSGRWIYSLKKKITLISFLLFNIFVTQRKSAIIFYFFQFSVLLTSFEIK